MLQRVCGAVRGIGGETLLFDPGAIDRFGALALLEGADGGERLRGSGLQGAGTARAYVGHGQPITP